MKRIYEDYFNQLVKDSSDDTTLVFGAITDDIPYPQVGVKGDVFGSIVITSALIRNIASHVNESPESLLGTIYEILQSIQKEDSVGKKS